MSDHTDHLARIATDVGAQLRLLAQEVAKPEHQTADYARHVAAKLRALATDLSTAVIVSAAPPPAIPDPLPNDDDA